MATPIPKDWRTLLPKIAQSKRREDVDFVTCLEGYLQTGDLQWASKVSSPTVAAEVEQMGTAVGMTFPWGEAERRVAEFAGALFRAHPSRRYPNYHGLLDGIMKKVWDLECEGQPAEGQKMMEALVDPSLGIDDLLDVISWNSYVCAFSGWTRGWQRGEGRAPLRPTTSEIVVLQQEIDVLVSGLHHDDGHTQYFLSAVAKERPEAARQWLDEMIAAHGLGGVPPHRLAALVGVVEDYDRQAFQYLVECREPSWVAELVVALSKRFSVVEHPGLRASALSPAVAAAPAVHDLIFTSRLPESLAVLKAVLSEKLFLRHPYVGPDRYEAGYAEAARKLGEGGRDIFTLVASNADSHAKKTALRELLRHADERDAPDAIELARSMLSQEASAGQREPLVGLMAELRPEWFVDDWWEMLGDSSKPVRAHAVASLAKVLGVEALSGATDRLASRKFEMRLGCVGLLAVVGGPQSLAALRAALDAEKSKAVRTEIFNALAQLGERVPEANAGNTEVGIDELEASLGTGKRRAAPGASWLDVAVLPPLYRLGGKGSSADLVVHFLAVQAAHKSLSVAPEIAPLLAQLDRARSGDFALALLEAWLASPQEAKDRWALALAGGLGDTRILPVLNSWIPKWCEKGRGKLAEYAAQAIALQGSDEALMFLDALATRYRSKQRNIGAAAAQAFQAAADARGLSADELGDLVVPGFGFNEDGLRDFTWEGGAARAELGVDLKLAWSDPESDKALKGLPASAPDALKAEVKELGKLLREAAKGQTARLELALVRQRRWPVARWRELYERHPVLRAFATRLVWGVYGTDGALLRCFRRYPNGLLADAAGGLEELPEVETQVGMVHPLELTADAIAAWRAHLARFKVEAPFPQLERPVERLDPLHANRRELAVAQDKTLGAGTFRSRAERRGWMRGSVVDGGGVAGYFKAFPGAGVEVSLEIDGLYIGIDPMETITLGVARFTRADSVKRGSYVYDDPQANDARVLAFGAVPPVVYSETVGDLKAIAGIGAAAGGEAGADADNDEA